MVIIDNWLSILSVAVPWKNVPDYSLDRWVFDQLQLLASSVNLGYLFGMLQKISRVHMHELHRCAVVDPLAEHVLHCFEIVFMVGQLSPVEHLHPLLLDLQLLDTLFFVLVVGVGFPLLLELGFPPKFSHCIVVELRHNLKGHVSYVLSVRAVQLRAGLNINIRGVEA